MSSHYHSYLPPTSGDTQLPVDKSNNNYKCPVNNNNNNNQAVKRFNQPQVLLPKGVKLLDIDSNGFNQNNSLNESTLLDQDREHFTPSFTSIQSHVQRKLLNFFFIYAIIIVSLYVTYAAYYYYQHHQWQRKSFMPTTSSKTTSDSQFQDFIHQQNAINFKSSTQNPDSMAITKQRLSQNLDSNDHQTAPMAASESELSKLFESKLHLLERYIEVIALDLQETKTRLKEREKCDCSMSCTFNGTKFTDQSTWKNQCDTCTCQVSFILFNFIFTLYGSHEPRSNKTKLLTIASIYLTIKQTVRPHLLPTNPVSSTHLRGFNYTTRPMLSHLHAKV